MTIEPIHVAFCVDDNFFKPAAVACASLAAHSGPARQVVAHVVCCGLQNDNRRFLEERMPAEVETIFHTLPTADIPMKASQEHWTPTVLARLFLERFLKGQVDRLLYLDADLIVLGDIADLYEFDLKGRAVGAVANIIEPWRSWDTRICPAVHSPTGAAPPGYFNSGVLLLDIPRWTQKGGTDTALRIYRDHGTNFQAPDQDTLNVQFSGDWVELPQQWNRVFPVSGRALPFFEPIAPGEQISILHFIGPTKPWHAQFPNKELRAVYREHARRANVEL